MNRPTILFPTDLSPEGQSALDTATSLARERGAKLLIVHVLDMLDHYSPGEIRQAVDKDQMMKALTSVAPTDPSVPCEHRLVEGNSARTIVRLAEEEGVDLIVMGTHGWSGVNRMLMGSVAEKVVRKASCPVLTIKNAQPATANA